MNIRYKKLHENAVAPMRGSVGAAGYDLTAVSREDDFMHGVVIYHTGLAFEIPEGYVGLLFPRSSVYKTGCRPSYCVGVLDSDYRGEVKCVFDIRREHGQYQVGDRVSQLVIVPYSEVEWDETDELSKTDRGIGGYGSTGR